MPSGKYVHKPLAEEHRNSISKTMTGRKRSSEHSENIRLGLLASPAAQKHARNLSLDQDIVDKRSRRSGVRWASQLQSSSEKKLQEILDREFSGQFIFVEGKTKSHYIWLDERRNWHFPGIRRRPDFRHISENKVIELCGAFFHGEKKTGRSPEEEANLIQSWYELAGFKCLVIWDSMLDDEKNLVQTIKNWLI